MINKFDLIIKLTDDVFCCEEECEYFVDIERKNQYSKKKKKNTHENQESYGQCHWLQQTRTNSALSKTVIPFKFRELLQ